MRDRTYADKQREEIEAHRKLWPVEEPEYNKYPKWLGPVEAIKMCEPIVVHIRQGDSEMTITYEHYSDFADTMNKAGSAWMRFGSLKDAILGLAKGIFRR